MGSENKLSLLLSNLKWWKYSWKWKWPLYSRMLTRLILTSSIKRTEIIVYCRANRENLVLLCLNTYLYCCRGSNFPVFVSHNLDASTLTMLRKRKKFTCQQHRNIETDILYSGGITCFILLGLQSFIWWPLKVTRALKKSDLQPFLALTTIAATPQSCHQNSGVWPLACIYNGYSFRGSCDHHLGSSRLTSNKPS